MPAIFTYIHYNKVVTIFFYFSEKARPNKETHEESGSSTSIVSAEGKFYEIRALKRREKRLLYSNYCTDITTADILTTVLL